MDRTSVSLNTRTVARLKSLAWDLSITQGHKLSMSAALDKMMIAFAKEFYKEDPNTLQELLKEYDSE